MSETYDVSFPIHHYKNGLKSYRDLPIRYAETAQEFRKEASGEMHGLIRIRQFTLSDGHIICTRDQLEDEFHGAVDLIDYLTKCLGLDKDISYRFRVGIPTRRINISERKRNGKRRKAQ